MSLYDIFLKVADPTIGVIIAVAAFVVLVWIGLGRRKK